MSIRHLITPAMVRAIDRQVEHWKADHPGKAMLMTPDQCFRHWLVTFEEYFRKGRGHKSAQDILKDAFTHETRSLVLTATERLEQDRQAPAMQGSRWTSPMSRLYSMYADQRRSAPDAPVPEILRRVVAAADA